MWEPTPSCAGRWRSFTKATTEMWLCLDCSCCLLLMLPEKLTIFCDALKDEGGNFTFLMRTGNAIYFRRSGQESTGEPPYEPPSPGFLWVPLIFPRTWFTSVVFSTISKKKKKEACDDFKDFPIVKYLTRGLGCKAFDLRAGPVLCSWGGK